VDVRGRDVVIVGAGFIVGRPLALLMLWRDATVTVCHIHTRDLKRFTRSAQVLVSATGVPGLIREESTWGYRGWRGKLWGMWTLKGCGTGSAP